MKHVAEILLEGIADMKVTIQSNEVRVNEGVSGRTQKPYKIRSQQGIAENHRFRMPVEVALDGNQPAYEVGEYAVDWEESITINGFGRVSVGRLILKKVSAAPSPR